MAKHIDKPDRKKDTKINPSATYKNISYENCKARIAFLSVCNNHCQLAEWHGNELKALIECFKKVEKLTWDEIRKDDGLNYEPKVSQIALPRPQTLPPDANLSSIRVNDKSRLFGYRSQDTFNIIWFDKNHVVCPMNKPKRYSI